MDVTIQEIKDLQNGCGNKPVLLEFNAPWCEACRMIDGILDRVERQYRGRAVIKKINIDQNPAVAQKYGVTKVPEIIVLKGGGILYRGSGYHNIRQIKSLLKL